MAVREMVWNMRESDTTRPAARQPLSTSAGAVSRPEQRPMGQARPQRGDGISLADCLDQIKSHRVSGPTIECTRMAGSPADTETASRTLVTHPELQSRHSFPLFKT